MAEARVTFLTTRLVSRNYLRVQFTCRHYLRRVIPLTALNVKGVISNIVTSIIPRDDDANFLQATLTNPPLIECYHLVPRLLLTLWLGGPLVNHWCLVGGRYRHLHGFHWLELH
jgi:hypothetical protein